MTRLLLGLLAVHLLVLCVPAAQAGPSSDPQDRPGPTSPNSADANPCEGRLGGGESQEAILLLAVAEDGAREHETSGRYSDSARCWARAAEAARQMAWPAQTIALLGRATRAALLATDYRLALAYGERRVDLARASESPVGEADALSDLGRAYAGIGDGSRAILFHRRALSIRRRDDSPSSTAASLRSLAALHLERGALDEARFDLVEALLLCESSEDPAGEATTWTELGRHEEASGAPERALACHRRAVETAEAAGDLGVLADTLAGLANALHRHRVTGEALQCCRRALGIYVRLSDPRGEAAILTRMACLTASAGGAESALDLHEQAGGALEAVDAADLSLMNWLGTAQAALAAGDAATAESAARAAVNAVPDVANGLCEEHGAVARDARADVFEVGIRASLELEDPEALFFFLEAGRAGALLELLADGERLYDVRAPESLRREERQQRQREADAFEAHRWAIEEGSLPEIRQTRAELESARNALRDVLERIQRWALHSTSSKTPGIHTLDRVRLSLRLDEALVHYGVLQSEIVALVIRLKGVRVVRLGAYDYLGQADARFDPRAPAHEAQAYLRDLTARLVTPLELDDAVESVLVSPDGPLHKVPFSALFGVREVACVPSATTYSVLLPEGVLRGECVLAIGDPQYGGTRQTGAVASVRSGLHLTPLPASRDEVLFAGDVTLLGAEATEAGLRFSLGRRPRWRAVHFACHGLLDDKNPTLSSLALTSTDADDGFLTALDLSRMRVPADLVVLSACHSGCGKVLRGEGALGLTRAFLSAGAPRVLVSLGAVDDEATGALMRHFYELWKAGLPTACALRHAQAHVRSQEQWSHPYFWASWTLWGLPR